MMMILRMRSRLSRARIHSTLKQRISHVYIDLMLLTHDLSINYILILIGPETAEEKILAVMAFEKALIEVTTEVDDDEEMLYSGNY